MYFVGAYGFLFIITGLLITPSLSKNTAEKFIATSTILSHLFLILDDLPNNASHAVNDFRKLCGIECYSPSDNVSELTARINDDGWETSYSEWLKISNLCEKDALFVLSVGGGDEKRNVSTNLISAIKLGVERQAKVLGIIGRDGGYVKNVADQILIIPTVNAEQVTPHSEAFQAVCWHCLVSHPKLKINETKW